MGADTGRSIGARLAAAAVAVVFLLLAGSADAATIEVDSTEDPPVANGNCSLREALASVDFTPADGCADASDPAIDTITFDGLPAGDHMIVADAQFTLFNTVKLDASGFDGEIRIDGNSAGDPFGLKVSGDNSLVKGLSVTRWDQQGIQITNGGAGTEGPTGIEIVDNFIGTDEDGTAGLGNLSFGISVGLFNVSDDHEPDNTLIEGNVISDNGNGISVRGDDTQNTTIRGNLIGTDPSGTEALGNVNTGLIVSGGPDTVTIGGSGAGQGNVIAANGGDLSDSGIRLFGASGQQITGVTIEGNTVGLESGATDLGNAGTGVSIGGDVDGTAIRNNAIAANDGGGIGLDDTGGAGPDDTTIRGNMIGTDAAGSAAVPNTGGPGVGVSSVNGAGTTGTTIGGPGTLGNVIAAGTGESGVNVAHNTATGTQVLGNTIGVNASGTGTLPGLARGITVSETDDVVIGSPAAPNTIGATQTAAIQMTTGVDGGTIQSNRIGIGTGAADVGNNNFGIELQDGDNVEIGGDAGAGEGNTIANNGFGIRLGELSDDNPIVGNEIFDNSSLAIDLLEPGSVTGETANDNGDGDTGANDLQNFVDISVAAPASSIKLIGELNSIGSTFYLVEVFTNTSPHPSGFGDGEKLVGSFEVETSVIGRANIDETIAGELEPGEQLSLTVTRLTGPAGDPVETSEFAPAVSSGHCESEVSSINAGVIFGTVAGETIEGTAGDDVICARPGDDTIDGGGGNDVLIGEAGSDTVDLTGAPGGVVVDLRTGTASGDGSDGIATVENVLGSPFADTLIGDDASNVLDGGGGADLLASGGGDDTINAADGEADNLINCGAGSDVANADGSAIDSDAIYGGCEVINRPAPPPGPDPDPTPTPDPDPPTPDPDPDPGADTAAPQLRISGRKKQKSPKKILVKATCADEGCELIGSGKVKVKKGKKTKKVKLKRAKATGEAGEKVKLTLKVKGKKNKKLLKKAIKRGKTSKAQVRVKATDAAGNAVTEKRTVKVKGKKSKK